MKKSEYSFMLEIYSDWHENFKIHYHKSGDIEGVRVVKRYNLIIIIFNTCYLFSIRGWRV